MGGKEEAKDGRRKGCGRVGREEDMMGRQKEGRNGGDAEGRKEGNGKMKREKRDEEKRAKDRWKEKDIGWMSN